MTSDEAKQIIEQDRKQRIADCQKEIAEALQKYNCALDPVIIIRGGEVMARVEVIAK